MAKKDNPNYFELRLVADLVDLKKDEPQPDVLLMHFPRMVVCSRQRPSMKAVKSRCVCRVPTIVIACAF